MGRKRYIVRPLFTRSPLPMTNYQKQLISLLSPAERRILARLTTPIKIQDYLDHFPENFSEIGDPIQNPSQVLANKKAHCIEGAVLAAAALAYHGKEPLLLDLQSTALDYDHVIAPFKQGGYWGAISKTNHPVLRWRDPVYKTVRELAMSYFNEYFWPERGRSYRTKTMVAYSRPFSLRKFHPRRWWAAGDLDWLAEELDQSPHYPALPVRQKKYLRKARPIEIKAMRLEEWPWPGK